MLLYFALTLFCSALLLFVVQPMVGKMILPALGGTPAVWTTCMLFFQVLLLAGYAYAHGAVRILGVRRQAGAHLLLMALPLLTLPVAVAIADVPTGDNPSFWLLGRLLAGVGLPFFVVSASAPLLQYWFSRTGHAAAADPYFLYGASNLGSMLALFGYPLVFERWWDLEAQARYWTWGYGLLAALVAGCAVLLWSRTRGGPGDAAAGAGAPAVAEAAVGGWRRARWVFLAFVPSSLMLGVTTHITTDLAPVPLLWVLPLALYLLTFIVVFARHPLIPHERVRQVTPFVLAPVALMSLQAEGWLGWLPIPLHLAMFFIAALLCHGELVADRPSTKHLTAFYLWMAVGGTLGGVFNALVAPAVFRTIAEYPLMMVLVYLAVRSARRAGVGSWAVALGLAVVFAGGVWALLAGLHPEAWRDGWPKAVTILLPAGLCVLLSRRSQWFAGALAGALVGCVLGAPTRQEPTLYLGRNFFGMKRVTAAAGGQYHVFLHGRTIHGIQDLRRPKVPLAYYHPSGPVGDIFRVYERARTARRVAILGLGAGAEATYAEASDRFDLYEIDPEVARIALDARLFTFLAECEGKKQVIVGDGRIRLGEVEDGAYGLIALDAFSSDSVPTHLLTREALALYFQKLDPRGLVVFNISNRYFDLAPLLAALAADAKLVCYVRSDLDLSPQEVSIGKMPSRFLVMARQVEDLRPLIFDARWTRCDGDRNFPIWTDRYSSILTVIGW